jgi:hypothetical protein
MTYKILFLKDGKEVGSTPWADKAGAIAHAEDHLGIAHRNFGANSVSVVDVDSTPEKTVFSKSWEDKNASRT